MNFKNKSVKNILALPLVNVDKQKPGGNISVISYDVHGATAEEIILSLEENNKNMTEDGFDAQARSNNAWNWFTAKQLNEGVCKASAYFVSSFIEYTLPNWTERYTSTDQKLNQQWDDYIKTVIVHETGHGIISYSIAERQLEIFKNYSEKLDENDECPEGFNDRLSALLDAEEIYNDVEYDDLTEHGFKQQRCDDNPFFTLDRDALKARFNDKS